MASVLRSLLEASPQRWRVHRRRSGFSLAQAGGAMRRPNIARMKKHQVNNYPDKTWEIFDSRVPDVQEQIAGWQARFRERMVKKHGGKHFWAVDMIIQEIDHLRLIDLVCREIQVVRQ